MPAQGLVRAEGAVLRQLSGSAAASPWRVLLKEGDDFVQVTGEGKREGGPCCGSCSAGLVMACCLLVQPLSMVHACIPVAKNGQLVIIRGMYCGSMTGLAAVSRTADVKDSLLRTAY